MRTKILYFALLALLLAGCVKETDFRASKGGIVLELALEDHQTKATRDGETDLNENLIAQTVDIFFYDLSTLQVTKEALGALRSGNLVQIQTNPNDIQNIFGTMGAGAKCGIFVVANFTGTYDGTPGNRTITEIKNTLLPGPDWEELPQDSFVMTIKNREVTFVEAYSTSGRNNPIFQKVLDDYQANFLSAGVVIP